MRNYKTVTMQQEVLDNVVCNMCGKKISADNDGYIEDYVHIDKTWNYHSDLDGQHHALDICAICYQKWVDTFAVGVLSAQ